MISYLLFSEHFGLGRLDKTIFHCIWNLEIELMLSHQNERIFECSFV